LGAASGRSYAYFGDKNEIFSALQDEGCALFIKWVAGISGGPIEALREYFLRYYEFSKAHPAFFQLLWVEHAAPRVPEDYEGMERSVSIGVALAQRALDEKSIPGDLAPHTVTGALWSAVQGPAVLGLLYNAGGDDNRAEYDQLAVCLLDLALGGLQSGAFSRVSTRHSPAAGASARSGPC
jgi:AcrR family transcriptional regulator